jgi:putative transposase
VGEVAAADPAALVGVISDRRTLHGIPHTVACRALGVSQAWFYKWRRRPAEPTRREVRGAALEERITYFFRQSGDTYGSPRITLDLWAEGWQVSVNTVAEVMAGLGLQGRKPPRKRHSLTRQGWRRAAPDLVHRTFDAIAPDMLWVGDMTGIDTDEGKLYPATVIDLFSPLHHRGPGQDQDRYLDHRLLQHPPQSHLGGWVSARRVRTDHQQGTRRPHSAGPNRIVQVSTIPGD